jgi:Rps23 Pro-64 3,4-dihydroxylase Tpa1-like proline 4-hydroxylase
MVARASAVHSLVCVVVITATLCRQQDLTAAGLLAVSSSSLRCGSLRRATSRLGATATAPSAPPMQSNRMFSNSVYESIQNGQIAVIPDFCSPQDLAVWQRDAHDLYDNGYFVTDALATYGKSGLFDPSKDRAVLKLGQWKNPTLGDHDARLALGRRLSAVRSDFATHLERPGLVQQRQGTFPIHGAVADASSTALSASSAVYGLGSTEISYTRFGPGASLARHVDEHCEELKHVAGWAQPTRRSLSWLLYLNNKWNADLHGGCLRCFERSTDSSHAVGSRQNGDLQIGWLRPSLGDAVSRPVFLDAQYGATINDSLKNGRYDHSCAMYIDDPRQLKTTTGIGSKNNRLYITKSFPAHPTLFVTGGELLIRSVLFSEGGEEYARRFYYIEPPKSAVTEWWQSSVARRSTRNNEERAMEVPPVAGTLVVFDSVALPHEVLPTTTRERWAVSGWMHEDQQTVTTHPHYQEER